MTLPVHSGAYACLPPPGIITFKSSATEEDLKNFINYVLVEQPDFDIRTYARTGGGVGYDLVILDKKCEVGLYIIDDSMVAINNACNGQKIQDLADEYRKAHNLPIEEELPKKSEETESKAGC